MAVSATVTERIPTPTGAEVLVRFVDGTEAFAHRFQTNGTRASLRQQVRAFLAQRAAVSDIAVGAAIDLADDPVAAPAAAPSQAETNAAQWAEGYERWKALRRGVALGAIAENDGPMNTLRNQLLATFIPAYRAVL